MRAVALLGQTASEKDVARFRLPGVELAIAPAVEPAEAALVFGGDGTVHRHLADLHALRVPTLVVPVGSGNDFAEALGIRRVEDAVAAWKRFVAGQGNVREIDLGRIAELPNCGTAELKNQDPVSSNEAMNDAMPSTHLFCCVGGVGLDAEANRRANAMPRWLRRRGGYMLAAALAILGKQRTQMRAAAASLTGEPLLDADEGAEMAVFANAPSYGGGMMIAPGARLDDGKLDLIYVRRTSRLRLLRIAPTVLRGTHIGLPEVWFARAQSVTVECEPARMIYADGEPICETPVRVSVLPKALRVVVP